MQPLISPIRYCPQCASLALSWPSAKHFRCNDCGFLLYLNVAAAVAAIIECQGKILFGVRKNEPQRGMLDLPGGFVDPGESVEQALRRELQEELGLALRSADYLFSYPNRYEYCSIIYDTLDIIFLVQLDAMPQIQAADDLAELLWVEREAIMFEQIGFSSLRQAVQRYLAESSRSAE